MKKLLLLPLLLIGCVAVSRPTPYPVEMPGGLSGTYVPCGSDLECQDRSVGICVHGYWLAETMTSLEIPHNQIGIVIVCCKNDNTDPATCWHH